MIQFNRYGSNMSSYLERLSAQRIMTVQDWYRPAYWHKHALDIAKVLE